jgi:hypothetical protein
MAFASGGPDANENALPECQRDSVWGGGNDRRTWSPQRRRAESRQDDASSLSVAVGGTDLAVVHVLRSRRHALFPAPAWSNGAHSFRLPV